LEKVKRTRRRVEKEDYARILLTETSTYDVPILFSNLGFYWHWKKFNEGKSLFPEVMERLFRSDDDYTIPLAFKVRKNGNSFRTLALMHPRSQVKFIEFYKQFDQQILLACQKSRFSIRYPDRVGSKYYVKNSNENRNKYKSRAISKVEHESRSKHLTTYFAYRSHTRLHSFFDSEDFRTLEKKYTTFWSLDVLRCFDTIYTHSITWALKNKSFAKKNIVPNTFGAIFDRLMQTTNYNETAGIVIGSEVSRIFSEIIFQKIDQNVNSRLADLGHLEGEQYTVRRYVDDIFVFAISEEIAKDIFLVIADALKEYKLSINENKTFRATRPFITEQSKAMRSVKNSYKILIDKLLKKNGEPSVHSRIPQPIFNRRSLLGTYLEEVKSACLGSSLSYTIVAGYLISSFSNLLINFTESNLSCEISGDTDKTRYANFCYMVLEIIFHLYTVSPSQNGSIKIGLIVQAACNFFDAKISDESDAVRSLIYTLANDFFHSGSFNDSSKNNDNSATVESLNVLAAVKILGDNYLISPQVIMKIVNVSNDRRMTYFEIITLLYYLGDCPEKEYGGIHKAIIKNIKAILINLGDMKQDSEKFHLLMDVLACPFIETSVRENFAKALWKEVYHKEPTDAQTTKLQHDFGRYPWFASWDSAEILNSLEKKALLRSY
jgi:hypothetical protein